MPTPVDSRSTSAIPDATAKPQSAVSTHSSPEREVGPSNLVLEGLPALSRKTSQHSTSDSGSLDLDTPEGVIKRWQKAGNADKELDFSEDGLEALPRLPENVTKLSIQGNKFRELPQLPKGILSLRAADNQITRLPDAFLESLFEKGKDGYFDFTDNPLPAYQVQRIRDVVAEPGYRGPLILYTAPGDMVAHEIKQLTDVGKTKLVGFLPRDRIKNLEAMERTLRQQGLVVRSFDKEECGVRSGALYAFDAECLNRFLNLPENKAVLDKHNVASTADEYIQRIAVERFQRSEKPDLYDLISLTFADPGEEYDGRRPVLADLKGA